MQLLLAILVMAGIVGFYAWINVLYRRRKPADAPECQCCSDHCKAIMEKESSKP